MMDTRQQQQQRLDEFKATFTADERRGLEGSDYANIAVGSQFSRNQLQKSLDSLRKNMGNQNYVRYLARGETEQNQKRIKALEMVLEKVTFQ